MTKKETQDYTEKGTIPKADPRSLKDNPADETVCSPYFSQGCINEDRTPSPIIEEEDEDEEH